jgi:hypothetical protein
VTHWRGEVLQVAHEVPTEFLTMEDSEPLEFRMGVEVDRPRKRCCNTPRRRGADIARPESERGDSGLGPGVRDRFTDGALVVAALPTVRIEGSHSVIPMVIQHLGVTDKSECSDTVAFQKYNS